MAIDRPSTGFVRRPRRQFMPNTFRALKYRNFRLLWTGLIISNAGTWMQTIAQGWLVLKLTGSALDIGLVGLVRAIPLIIFSLIGGASADFIDRRKLLYLTQTILALSALTLGFLTVFGWVQVWHVYVLSFVSAVALAFDQPARQSLAPKLVPREDLMNALALNSLAFQGSALFGPAATALLAPFIGLGGCFIANGLSFASVIYALSRMDMPAGASARRTRSAIADLTAGIKFAAAHQSVLALLLMGAITSVFGRGYNAFLPVFAQRVLNVGLVQTSFLATGTGVGTIFFSLAVASLTSDFHHKGKLAVSAMIAFTLVLGTYAWSKSMALSYAMLILLGGLNSTLMATVNTTVQSLTTDDVRGRVMSLFTVANLAGMPLGQVPMGYFIQKIGPSLAVAGGAGIVFVGVASVLAFLPAVWATP